jgi:hypothetical protein
MFSILGKKIIRATKTERVAETRTMAAETSLAILASARLSSVIKSTMDSIAVLTISATRTVFIVKTKISHSIELMEKYNQSLAEFGWRR